MKPMDRRFTLTGNQNMSFEIVSKKFSTTRSSNFIIRLLFSDLNGVYTIVKGRWSPINTQPKCEINSGRRVIITFHKKSILSG